MSRSISSIGSGSRCRHANVSTATTPFVPHPALNARTPSRILNDYIKRHVRALAAVEGPDASAAAAAATAAERRRLRQLRRAARQPHDDSSSDDEYDSSAQTEQLNEAPHTVAAEQQAEHAESSAEAPAAAAQGARQPGSRIAARRQQRARLRGSARRVPAALVPHDIDVFDDDDDFEDEEDAADEDTNGRQRHRAVAAGAADVTTSEPDDATSEQEAAAAAADADADEGSPSEQQQQQQQLPQSILQKAQGGKRSQQQQQRQAGSSSSPGSRREPLELSEASPMYVPVLTDEDLAADPPGHKSGYVAVIGRPNAGKSTLINAIVGQKLSIVTFKPQTTRHRVVGIASDTHYQMILFDTPGIMQEQRSKLDERMMAAVVSSIKAAEVIIAVVDASDEPQEALAMFQPGPDWSGPPMAVLINKTDLITEEQLQQLQQWYKDNCRAEQVFVGCALSSQDNGVEAIKAWAVDKLPEGPTLYPKSMVSEQPERFFVSEIIREQIFLQYKQEIPYACQVQITEFKEGRNVKDYIQAVILVERESQAPIVMGKGGAALRRLGSAARLQIEEFLSREVFLELSVQVAPSWRQQADKLKDFGYFDALYVS